MSIHNGGRAAISNIRYSDIDVESLSQPSGMVGRLVELQIVYGKYQTTDPKQYRGIRGSIANIEYNRVAYHSNGLSYLFSDFMGNSSQHAVSNVSLQDIEIDGKGSELK